MQLDQYRGEICTLREGVEKVQLQVSQSVHYLPQPAPNIQTFTGALSTLHCTGQVSGTVQCTDNYTGDRPEESV